MHARLEEVILFSQNPPIPKKDLKVTPMSFWPLHNPRIDHWWMKCAKKAGPLLPLPFRSAIYIHDLLLKKLLLPISCQCNQTQSREGAWYQVRDQQQGW